MENQNSLEFIKDFYGLSFSEKEKNRFLAYSQAISLKGNKVSWRNISKILQVPKSTIEKWFSGKSTPVLVKLQKHYFELRASDNKKMDFN